jgi:hypothetical protein
MAAPAIGLRPGFAPMRAAIDWSHPLAAGLVFYAMPGTGLPDLVRGYTPTYTATEFVGTKFGPAAALTGSTSQVTYGTGPVMGGASDWTAIAALRVNAGTAGTVLCKRNAFSAAGEEFRLGMASGGALVISAGGTFTNFSLAGVVARSQSVVGVTATASACVPFVNGRVVAGTTAANRRSSGSAGANTITVGRINAEGDGLGASADGAVALAAAWNRALTAAQMAQIMTDPFCLLRY